MWNDKPNIIVNIPDNNFLNALIQSGIDTNGDSLIRYNEAGEVTFLDVQDKKSRTWQVLKSL